MKLSVLARAKLPRARATPSPPQSARPFRAFFGARTATGSSHTHLITLEREEVFGVAVAAALDAGGDFADGVIAYEGKWLGGETFVSFDKKAVALLTDQGHSARML
jgi:hypothetical protein